VARHNPGIITYLPKVTAGKSLARPTF